MRGSINYLKSKRKKKHRCFPVLNFILVCLFLLFSSISSLAQERFGETPTGRPSSTFLPLTPKTETPPPAQLDTPPLTPESPQIEGGLALKVFVNEIKIVGNTVFSDEELEKITAPFTNRQLMTEDLDLLRQKLTLHYIDAGYINSGVFIPDQTVTEGIITLQVVEGRLTTIELEGDYRFADSYLENRIRLHSDGPLNIHTLQQALQQLHSNQLIDKLHSRLKPGMVPGESILNVEVKDHSPFLAHIGFDNYQSPSVGAWQGWATLSHRNLTGHSDPLRFGYGASEGAEPQLDIAYSAPITASDSTLTLRYRKNDYSVIEEPFDQLDVESKSEIYHLGLRVPLYHDLDHDFALGLQLEHLRHETFLLGAPFSFSPGAIDGKAKVTAFRCTQEWTRKTQQDVLAVRSQISFGLTALGATTNSGDTPDSRFISWLGQFQWARVLPMLDSQFLFRTDLQLANDALLPLEQIAVGGRFSVRGYRENQLVRDQGLIASLEARIPIVQNTGWADYLQLATFLDLGKGWNKDQATPPVKDLASIGLGIRWAATWKSTNHTWNPQLEIYWGYPLNDVNTSNDDLQDDGFHMQLTLAVF